jgi:hypothetical protein
MLDENIDPVQVNWIAAHPPAAKARFSEALRGTVGDPYKSDYVSG